MSLGCIHLVILLPKYADTPGAPRQWWFGGGTDLTPAYIFEEDVKHFHSVYLKSLTKRCIFFFWLNLCIFYSNSF